MNSNSKHPSSSKQCLLTVQEMQQEFSRKAGNLLLPNHPSGTALLNFIRYHLTVWHMDDVDPQDILADAVYQGLVFIQNRNQPIENPKAWLRVTCLNLLKKQVRKTVNHGKLCRHLKESSSLTENPLAAIERSEWLDQFHEAVTQLPPEEQDLIRFRLFEDKTYEQIYYWLESRDGKAPDIPTIRKRYSRALNRLKSVFPKLNQDSHV